MLGNSLPGIFQTLEKEMPVIIATVRCRHENGKRPAVVQIRFGNERELHTQMVFFLDGFVRFRVSVLFVYA